MALFLVVSRHSHIQWNFWAAVKALSTHVVSAEAAQHVAQHGSGLVRMPEDMVQTLDGYFKDAGLTGKRAKLRSLALTDQLKALSRTQAKGGLQPYRSTAAAAAAAAVPVEPAGVNMTREQLQEQQEMDGQLEQMAAAFGPEALQRHRQMRAAAEAAAALPLPKTRSGRLKAKAKAALHEHIQAHGMLSVPHEHLRAALDLPPSSTLAHTDKALQLKKITPAYNEEQALAYALARLPGCYAASLRIFKELAVRLPGLRPRTLLDFGAGPGTASWAAQEAWPESLARLTAVEPSGAMRRLGERLEAARRFAHQHSPVFRWSAALPPIPRGQRKAHSSQSMHDVVVASYVLGEVADPLERATLVRHLWALTSDVLVLIEPGTPAGAATIQNARAAILQHEARRSVKLRRRQAALTGLLPDSSSTEPSAEQPDHNLSAKLGSKWYGAHVVSPCPHDGPCPLAAPGSKAWCHFGTRFQRPSFMQAAKALPGTHINPMDHQDERYSYVVIRRGARPVVTTEVDISRTFLPKGSNTAAAAASAAVQQVVPSDSECESESGGGSGTECESDFDFEGLQQQQQQVRGMSITDERSMEVPDLGSSSNVAALAGSQQQESQRRKLFGDLDQQQQHGTAPGPGSPHATAAIQAVREEEGDGSLLTRSELQQLSSLLGITTPAAAATATAVAAAAAATGNEVLLQQGYAQHSASSSDHYKHVNSKLDGFGEGLVDKLIALENAGVDWAAGGLEALTPQVAAQAAQMQLLPQQAPGYGRGSSSQDIACHSRGAVGEADFSANEAAGGTAYDVGRLITAGDDACGQEAEVKGRQGPSVSPPLYFPAELEQAAAASLNWSRIIRPPRKRGGHVILDLCTCHADVRQPASMGNVPDAWPVAGQLERHTVARSDANKWMGKAAYAMAQDAQWGDLWPAAYNRNYKKQVLE